MERSPVPRIRTLPERLANQIAAGEVVERPASVLKELLENSLDAGAARVSVDLEYGGTRLIRVRDDGTGMHGEDLALALARHATSKIASLDDLENVASLGFRGEALPSIASVSRLEICSCAADADSGWAVSIEGGASPPPPRPVAHPPGTTVSVRDLFYNTPARRKFLRTEKTEYRHLEDVLKRAALSRFECAFTLRHNGRESFAVAVAGNDAERARRVARLCGSAFMERSVAFAFAASDLQVSGWIGAPGYDRGVADLQYFFVNGRMVRDQLLRHAVRQAHEGVVQSGRHPAYVLYLELDPAQVDVNVHPSKHEVRFRDARSVHDFVVRSLRQALAGDGRPDHAPPGDAPRAPVAAPLAVPARGPQPPGRIREQASAYAALRAGAPGLPGTGNGALGEAIQHLDHRYVLAHNGCGVAVVDARRAARLVARAGLSRALETGPIPARPLLVPVPVAVGESQADRLERCQAFLAGLGFDLRRVAPASVSCRGIPAPLAGADPGALVRAVDARLVEAEDDGSGDEPLAFLDALLAGCDLTAGWSWDRDTMNDLLRQLERLPDAGRTPEGDTVWHQLEADDCAALLPDRPARMRREG